MLYRIIINNYKSFAEAQQFDAFPNLRRDDFLQHLHPNAPVPVLKESAIYGANGSGKSNFVQALAFLKRYVVTETDVPALRSWYGENQFRLPVSSEPQPIEFTLEFGIGESMYIYNVAIDQNGVAEENLYKSGRGKASPTPIFTRESTRVNFFISTIGEETRRIFMRQLEENPALSVLGINGRQRLIDYPLLDEAFDWFKNYLKIVAVDRDMPWLIEQLLDQEQILDFVNDIYAKIGLGIERMSIVESDMDEWISSHESAKTSLLNKMLGARSDAKHSISQMKDSAPALDIVERDGRQKVREFVFRQLGRNGYVGDMDATMQSTGTLRLLTLIPAIYYATEEECTVLVDEIDNGIHPILIKKLIEHFGNNTQAKGQLIFTTHETALLNQKELLRADEIWFTEKIDGVTRMYSLNDFKPHKTISIENGYLEGRYGAIPFLGEL